MYLILLVLAAFLILSLFTTNWPVRLYHGRLLVQIAREFQAPVPDLIAFWSQVSPEIRTTYHGYPIRIRFLEPSVDSLKHVNSGLEFRIEYPSQIVLELYHQKLKKREWGHFQKISLNNGLEGEWLPLTPEPEKALPFLERMNLGPVLTVPYLEQLLFNRTEVIVRLGRYGSAARVRETVDRLLDCLPK